MCKLVNVLIINELMYYFFQGGSLALRARGEIIDVLINNVLMCQL